MYIGLRNFIRQMTVYGKYAHIVSCVSTIDFFIKCGGLTPGKHLPYPYAKFLAKILADSSFI